MFDTIIKLIEAERKAEAGLLNAYEASISKSPWIADYSLKGRVKRGKMRYYKVNRSTHKETYIRSENANEVEDLQLFAYKRKVIEIINQNLIAISIFLDSFKPITPSYIISLLAPCYRSVPIDSIYEPQQSATEWKREMEAEKSRARPYRPEKLTQKTIDGSYVRSRGEMLIYNYLSFLGVAFVYELPLRANGKIFHPDFTIYLPKSGKILIWEHCGMLYNLEYFTSQHDKLNEYADLGFSLGDNLIVTADKKDETFDMTIVKRMVDSFIIDEYFQAA